MNEKFEKWEDIERYIADILTQYEMLKQENEKLKIELQKAELVGMLEAEENNCSGLLEED